MRANVSFPPVLSFQHHAFVSCTLVRPFSFRDHAPSTRLQQAAMRTPSLPALFLLVCLLAPNPTAALPIPNIDGLLAAISAQIAEAIPVNTIPTALRPAIVNPKAPLNPKHNAVGESRVFYSTFETYGKPCTELSR